MELTDEHCCADVLAQVRWPRGFECRACGRGEFTRVAARPRVFECTACGTQNSVTAGTALHGTKLPLRTWLQATVLASEGISANRLSEALGVSYETAFQALHRIRDVLRGRFASHMPDPDLAPKAVQVGWSTITMRGPSFRRPGNRLCLVSVERLDGWHYGPVTDEVTARLMLAVAQKCAIERRWPAANQAWSVCRGLRRRYRGVSERWLGHYLTEVRALECRLLPEHLRKALLGASPRPWRILHDRQIVRIPGASRPVLATYSS
jgi:transposase-like protein